jgi:hypothetical protein
VSFCIVQTLSVSSTRSLSPQCTPLKQRYDGCFNAWFEGYLQPALDASTSRTAYTPHVDSAQNDEPSSPEPSRPKIITNWSSAFRPRGSVQKAPEVETKTAAPSVYQHTTADMPPIDKRGKTRAQIKAEEYERNCGAVWRQYKSCLTVSRDDQMISNAQKAIEENPSLSTLLEQAREDHPLPRLDGLQGTAWDPSTKVE